MTIANVFENIVQHYVEAGDVTPPYKAKNIFRSRQSSIAGISEDLFAFFLQQHFAPKYTFPIYFMIDYPMRPEKSGGKMCPDIAIIIEESEPILASYIDIKMDLGFQRDYFKSYPMISTRILELRKSGFTGTMTIKDRPIKTSPAIKWRTVVLAKKNSDGQHFSQTITDALAISDFFELYFLSDNQHPNTKSFSAENILYPSVDKLLANIQSDIETARGACKAG
jgi:hypothetical protein